MLLYVLTIGVTTAVVTSQRNGSGQVTWPGFAGLMVADPRVPQLAAYVAVLAGAQAPLLVIGILGNAVSRAHGDSRIGLIAGLVGEYGVFLPVGWALIRELDFGISGVMVAHLAYWLAYIVIIAPRRRARLAGRAP